jgi:alpha-ketoglutarate-dependent taurine dioxygenase
MTTSIADKEAAAAGTKEFLPVQGPMVWDKASLGENYVLQLTEQDIEELNRALTRFKALGLDGDRVTRDNFVLPTLGEKLKHAATNIHAGNGVVLVRGMKPEAFSVEDNVSIYLGISSYIGDKRGMQNKSGNMLTHVTDSKAWNVAPEKRHGIHTSAALPFHNDMGSDILALQVRQCASEGGNTFLASAWTVYNDLLSTDPKALELLFSETWPLQTSGSSYVLAPLMQLHDGNVMLSVDPPRFGPQPSAGRARAGTNVCPDLTSEQHKALEALRKAAGRHDVKIELETGDILFFNNWAILHRREPYRDDAETSRHLVRLWLRNSELGWDIPASMAKPWIAAFKDAPTVDRVYPVNPMPNYQVPVYTQGSAAFVLEDGNKNGDKED